jgi:HPt (histidine-containing phosphotransfer) domain-containing protein
VPIQTIAQVNDALHGHDSKALERAAHKLNGSASLFGVVSVTKAFSDLEQLAREHELDDA